ncbi:MAG: hypothetical protein J0M11_13000 [Anaerolineae bacterium]|nr:hypothetical protein [Anaerolineae bacterium]
MDSLRKSIPFVLISLSLGMAIYQFVITLSVGEWRNSSEEMVSKWEERIQSLHEAIPADVIQVGYVDDSALKNDPTLFDANEFQLMQYSVAPAAMDTGMKHEWIIGNFNDDENLETWLTEQIGAYELQGFGFGVYLIHDVEN